MILNQGTGSGSLPLANPSYHTKVIRRVRPAPQANNPIPDGVISLWSDCCSMSILVWTQTVSCPRVTQAVLYVHRFIHSTRRWSILAGNTQVLALPFSTQIPDCAVPHTFVQPIDCLMSNPYLGDTNWIPGTSGWREGVSTPTMCCLVPVPGCLLGSEPATCPRTPLSGRKFTPASTSETGRKSSADRKPHL